MTLVSRTAPYGKSYASSLTAPNELALRAVTHLVAEIDDRVGTDPTAAAQLSERALSLLLEPRGRALLPYASATIARLLTYRQRVVAAARR
jgi:hypothetical protein